MMWTDFIFLGLHLYTFLSAAIRPQTVRELVHWYWFAMGVASQNLAEVSISAKHLMRCVQNRCTKHLHWSSAMSRISGQKLHRTSHGTRFFYTKSPVTWQRFQLQQILLSSVYTSIQCALCLFQALSLQLFYIVFTVQLYGADIYFVLLPW